MLPAVLVVLFPLLLALIIVVIVRYSDFRSRIMSRISEKAKASGTASDNEQSELPSETINAGCNASKSISTISLGSDLSESENIELSKTSNSNYNVTKSSSMNSLKSDTGESKNNEIAKAICNVSKSLVTISLGSDISESEMSELPETTDSNYSASESSSSISLESNTSEGENIELPFEINKANCNVRKSVSKILLESDTPMVENIELPSKTTKAICNVSESISTKATESDTKAKVEPVEEVKPKTVEPEKSKTLIEEEPYVATVTEYLMDTTCSKCFAWNYKDQMTRVQLHRCSGCKVVHYCSKRCQKADWKDHKAECKFLQSSNGDVVPDDSIRLLSRMLVKSKTQPDWKAFNGRTYESLQDHCETQKKDSDLMKEANIVFADLEKFMGPETPDFETFFLTYSKMLINSTTIAGGSLWNETRGSAVYLGLSVHNHSCRPDAFAINRGSKLLLRTTNMDCTYNDEITIDYMTTVSLFRNTETRRAHLQKYYCFTCMCEGCLDVEEDRKKSSGRPACCRDGWFDLDELRCSSCGKEVDPELGNKAKGVNENMIKIMREFEKGGKISKAGHVLPFVECKRVLSKENSYLMSFAYMMCRNGSVLDLSLKLADFCLPEIMKSPIGFDRINFLCYRYLLLEKLHTSFVDEKHALEQAFEEAKIVFGLDHELTLELGARKDRADYIAETRF